MKKLLLVGFLVVQVFLTVGFGTTVAYGLGHNRALQGLAFLGIDLSNLTEQQAYERLRSVFPAAVTVNTQAFPLKTDQSFAAVTDWLHKQYIYSDKSVLLAALSYVRQLQRTVAAPPVYLMRQEIWPQLEQIKSSVDKKAEPASISYSNGQLVRQAGRPGLELDLEASWQKLLGSHGQSAVPLVAKSIPAQPDDGDLVKVKDLIADYTTYFNPADQDRTNNVRLAAEALEDTLVAPGDEFSFNKRVGERSEQAGYLPAYIFADRQVVIGDGGGVCQDSSTLYQAVRQAHLQVVERNSHSLPVNYVPKGDDATVAYGLLDFRFRNDTKGYLLISAHTGSNWLRVRIFGVGDQTHQGSALPEGYPFKPMTESDPSIPEK